MQTTATDHSSKTTATKTMKTYKMYFKNSRSTIFRNIRIVAPHVFTAPLENYEMVKNQIDKEMPGNEGFIQHQLLRDMRYVQTQELSEELIENIERSSICGTLTNLQKTTVGQAIFKKGRCIFTDITGLKRVALAATEVIAPNKLIYIMCNDEEKEKWNYEIKKTSFNNASINLYEDETNNKHSVVIVDDRNGENLSIDRSGRPSVNMVHTLKHTHRAEFVLILRKKPFSNPLEMYAAMKIINPSVSYMKFTKQYMSGKLDEATQSWIVGKFSNSKELTLWLKKTFLIRNNQEEVMKQLAEKTDGEDLLLL